ncbi:MAG TPA: hypothetical protein VI279_13150 [Rhodocyclaceae bacterium]
MTSLIRKAFLFFVQRAGKSRLAALVAALLALCFARRLMQRAATDKRSDSRTRRADGRVIDGEYRRVDDHR